MGFILKMAAGLYVLFVLAFSSWSRASDGFYPLNTSAISSGSMAPISKTGVVFEENGFLYFQTDDNNVTLIHSNSFAFFESLELPQYVSIDGQSTIKNQHNSSLNSVLQVTSVTILK